MNYEIIDERNRLLSQVLIKNDIKTLNFVFDNYISDPGLRRYLTAIINGDTAIIYETPIKLDFDITILIIEYLILHKEPNRAIVYLISTIDNPVHLCEALISYSAYLDPTVVNVLKRIDNDKLKSKMLKRCNNKDLKLYFVKSMSSDTNKIAELHHFEGDTLRLKSIAIESTSTKLKETVINLLDDENSKTDVAMTFKDDLRKLDLIFKVTSPHNKVNLIASLRDDTFKIQHLATDKFTKSEKTTIILSLKNKEFKRALLSKMYTINDNTGKEFKRIDVIYDGYDDTLPRDLTFGIEIEVQGPMSKIILESMDTLYDKWDVKADSSLDDGVEFTSKIFTYSETTLKDIYKICEFIKGNKLYADKQCALHMHFGSRFLKNYDSWFWLYYIYCTCERIFYLISNEPGQLPRDGIKQHAMFVSKKASNFLMNYDGTLDLNDFIREFQKHFFFHYQGINISNIGIKMNTIEFRAPNGTTNPEIIVQNLILYGNLMRLARELSYLPPTEKTYNLIKAFDNDIAEEERLELLLDLLFKDEKNKKIFRTRYLINKDLHNEEELPLGHNKDFNLKGENIAY